MDVDGAIANTRPIGSTPEPCRWSSMNAIITSLVGQQVRALAPIPLSFQLVRWWEQRDAPGCSGILSLNQEQIASAQTRSILFIYDALRATFRGDRSPTPPGDLHLTIPADGNGLNPRLATLAPTTCQIS
jgi:hypothetical protein